MLKIIPCAVCKTQSPYRVLYKERIPDFDFNFAPRTTSNRHHFRVVECAKCGLVYSNPIFEDEKIMQLYHDSIFIDETQAHCMNEDYIGQFESILPLINRNGRLLEVGCSNGLFLKAARKYGFSNLYGVEPSKDAVRQADSKVKALIINDTFKEEYFEKDFFDVVCCFQILDHLLHPDSFLQSVYRVLKKGGIVLAVNHNIKFPLVQLMKEYSPFFHIEHVYLFDKTTMRNILANNHFEVLWIKDIPSRYTIEHGLKMFPFHPTFRDYLIRVSRKLGLADKRIRVKAGNMVSVARK